jgi:hypothetical protein
VIVPGDAPPLPERRLTVEEAHGLITLQQVVTELQLAGGSAVTNWIARQKGEHVGRVYKGYRLRGKGLLPGAQKPGWLWEKCG